MEMLRKEAGAWTWVRHLMILEFPSQARKRGFALAGVSDVNGLPGNVPSATAKRAAVLGKISYV